VLVSNHIRLSQASIHTWDDFYLHTREVICDTPSVTVAAIVPEQ
jgi:hypothetical protein